MDTEDDSLWADAQLQTHTLNMVTETNWCQRTRRMAGMQSTCSHSPYRCANCTCAVLSGISTVYSTNLLGNRIALTTPALFSPCPKANLSPSHCNTPCFYHYWWQTMCALLVWIPPCPLSPALYGYGILNSLSSSVWYLLYTDLPHGVSKESVCERRR